MSASCKNSNEISGFQDLGAYLDNLSDHQFVKKEFSRCSYFVIDRGTRFMNRM
jgi:hypothetical protein